MGGFGSGSRCRYDKKDTVEDCRRIDANRWMREGILAASVHHSGLWCWFRDASRTEQTASMGYEVCTLDLENSWLRLFYTLTQTKEVLDYRVRLTTTRPRFGGLRWWFACPLVRNGAACGRRVAKVYLQGRYFGCRHCYQLTYTSCQESHKYDSLFRLLARNTGYDFETVKQAMNSIGRSHSV